MLALFLFLLSFLPMSLEARRSRANDRALRAQGAQEAPGDVYRAMQVAYPACFLGMIVEAWLRRRSVNGVFAAGALVFVAAKALKYWAIASLGPRWSFRVMVLSGTPLITSGPYRYLRHPNYVGVVGELLGMALMAQAPVIGTIAIAGFGALLAARVRAEERVLGRGSGAL